MALSESERRKAEQAEARKRLSEEERRKAEEKERKKAEVRARLEEAAAAKKGKKGFMTPERKSKLRALLRKNAAEAVKREQERKAAERRQIVTQRIGEPQPLEGLSKDKLEDICREYHSRLTQLEEQKYELEYLTRQRDFMINEISSQVNDMRGKFVKPTLKKVSKYEGKLEKMAKIAAKAASDFRNNLKRVQSTKFTMEEKEEEKRPDWAASGKKEKLEVGDEEEGEEEE